MTAPAKPRVLPVPLCGWSVRQILADLKHSTARVSKPPWKAGDILYGKEAVRIDAFNAVQIRGKGIRTWVKGYYLADDTRFEGNFSLSLYFALKNRKFPRRATSSRYMRKEFARLFLRVLDVQEMRLCDFTLKHIVAEGIPSGNWSEFKKVWDNLYPEPEHCSAANPRIWFTTFERTEKPEL